MSWNPDLPKKIKFIAKRKGNNMDARLVALQNLGEKVLNIYFSTADKIRRQKKYDEAVQWFLERFEGEGVKINE